MKVLFRVRNLPSFISVSLFFVEVIAMIDLVVYLRNRRYLYFLIRNYSSEKD